MRWPYPANYPCPISVSPAARVRVLIAEEHPLYREGVVRAIKERPELELVGEAADGGRALALIKELQPDVAVLDVKMPELDGLQVANAVARDLLPTRVLMLSAFLDRQIVFQAVAGGAAGYLSKDANRLEITDAILAVHRGDTVLAQEVQAGVAAEVRSRWRPDAPSLSDRERQVLEMIAEGMSAPEIGRRLYLSTATVKSHLQSLYEKLGVSDRAAAVAAAMRRGLLE
jgi:two-component system, NarL family, nitrate/nitrite response regulator NarL